jgi:hypothetical protein
MKISSQLPIEVIIPAAEKDAAVLPYVIAGVRKNIRHPITRIRIVSPKSTQIQKVCFKKNCQFVDERSVLDVTPESINLKINGVDRSTWIFQQFLKWSGDKFSEQAHYLVVDADTVFIRPQVFEIDGKTVFNFSNEYHQPYFDIYQRLLGEAPRFPLSFTSHQMLFEKRKLAELKAKIEGAHQCDWKVAILKNIAPDEVSGHSDYETYGQYVFAHYRNEVFIDYWFNSSRRRKDLRYFFLLEFLYRHFYKSMSFHSWHLD